MIRICGSLPRSFLILDVFCFICLLSLSAHNMSDFVQAEKGIFLRQNLKKRDENTACR